MRTLSITVSLASCLLLTACQRPPSPKPNIDADASQNPIKRGVRSSDAGMAIDGVPDVQNPKSSSAQ